MMKILFEAFAHTGSTYLGCLIHAMYRCEVEGVAHKDEDPEKKFVPKNHDMKLYKAHRPDAEPCLDVDEFKYSHIDFDKFICIVRSPLESIPRHNEWDVKLNICRGNKWVCQKTEDFILHYKKIIDDYEAFDGPSEMIFYEDLMEDPRSSLKKVRDLIGDDTHNSVDTMMHNLPKLRMWAANGHELLDEKSDSGADYDFDPYKHQVGMPLDVYERYREALLPEYEEYVGRYFNKGPVYERWKAEN